jgi:ABC-type Zn uptake system ZnuABC Zn-binding protein ZnuA
MRRAYLLLLLGVPLLFLFASCSPPPNFWEEAKPKQKRVLVSFPPLYAITSAVAGDDAYVLSMLTGKGPHDYDGGPTDLFMLNKADLLIYNGLTLDDTFVKRMRDSHRNSKLAVLNVGEALEEEDHERAEKNKKAKVKLPALLLSGDGEEHVHADGEVHRHGEFDPHVWLGPDQAIAMTEIIAAKLGDIDPEHKKGYEKRAAAFIEELKKLKADGKAALRDKKNKNIVTMHESLRYFAQGFDVKIVGSIQLQPGMDPDAVKMKDLIELCIKDGVRVIAVEPQYKRAPAETLQRSLKEKNHDVEIVEIDPLETVEVPAGKKHNPDPGYYLKKMRENFEKLAKALP